MPYSLITYADDNNADYDFDKHLGSAAFLEVYWIRIAYKLGLPIISKMLDRADSEDGFVLRGQELKAFASEVSAVKNFWEHEPLLQSADSDVFAAPDGLCEVLSEIELIALKASDNNKILAVC